MALIKSVRGFTPQIGKDTFLADNATIIGDVEIGEGCSIWFGTVLRGDVNSIRIGNGVNIQDGSPYTKNRRLRSATMCRSATTSRSTGQRYATAP